MHTYIQTCINRYIHIYIHPHGLQLWYVLEGFPSPIKELFMTRTSFSPGALEYMYSSSTCYPHNSGAGKPRLYTIPKI